MESIEKLPEPPINTGGLAPHEQSTYTWYEEQMKRCHVLIDIEIPLIALADGVHARNSSGNGIIVHHSATLGLVLVDRNTAVVAPCDVLV